MPISQALQTLYTSAPVDRLVHQCIVLSHPTWIDPYYFVNWAYPLSAVFAGQQELFAPMPFVSAQPDRSTSGQQDLALVLCNVGREMLRALELAIAQPDQRILLRYTEYIEGDPVQQIDPAYELSLTNISVDATLVRANATRADTINAPFPRRLFTPELWPGLVR